MSRGLLGPRECQEVTLEGNDERTVASYVKLLESGELSERVQRSREILASCRLCPRGCGADRLRGQVGECRTGAEACIASYGPHYGEEAPLVGHRGSGTIFFAGCNLRCVFCQNYAISQLDQGASVSAERLASIMLRLQEMGCHNINLVSPTHVVPQILAALEVAARGGLSLPLVYNTGGYDTLPTLRLLDGVVDIYMPDMKYDSAEVGEHLSGASGYPSVNRAAVLEMHRQVGDLVVDRRGVAVRGLIIRHLVLPHGLAGTAGVVHFIAQQLSRGSYVNLMDQYSPHYRAGMVPELARRITWQEFEEAVAMARDEGLARGICEE